jgi:uncharacterized phage protein gp47/JayE
MAPPSFDQLMNLGKAEAILRRPSLGVRVGDISEMLIAAAAAMADRLVGWFAERIAATFLDGASGDDLTQLAADHWSIQRRAATPSISTVTFNRAGADASIRTFPIGTVVATERDSQGNDVQFVTKQEASWAASTNGARVVNVEAVNAGVAGNLSDVNLISRIISTPPAGGTYTITASTQPVGGSEEETDEELRDRTRLYPSTLRRGTLAALEYGAKSISTIAIAKASAIQDTTGLVTVYVSDASGGSTGTTKEVNPLTVDDGTMTAKVAVELLSWACAGSLVNVSGGTVQTVNITVTIAVKLGIDVNQLITDIQNSISARVGKLNIGETLYLSDITSAVKAVDPDNIVNVVVNTPLVDTVPSTPGSLIRAGVITVG